MTGTVSTLHERHRNPYFTDQETEISIAPHDPVSSGGRMPTPPCLPASMNQAVRGGGGRHLQECEKLLRQTFGVAFGPRPRPYWGLTPEGM